MPTYNTLLYKCHRDINVMKTNVMKWRLCGFFSTPQDGSPVILRWFKFLNSSTSSEIVQESGTRKVRGFGSTVGTIYFIISKFLLSILSSNKMVILLCVHEVYKFVLTIGTDSLFIKLWSKVSFFSTSNYSTSSNILQLHSSQCLSYPQ